MRRTKGVSPPPVHRWPRRCGHPRNNRIQNDSVLNLSCVDGTALESILLVAAMPCCHGGAPGACPPDPRHACRVLPQRREAQLPLATGHCMGGIVAARFAASCFHRCAGPVAQWLEPTAHNGLVGGSSPPGPTIFSDLALTFVAVCARMFAFGSRISLANRWSSGLAENGCSLPTAFCGTGILPLRPRVR
jgi:hypothetical protein